MENRKVNHLNKAGIQIFKKILCEGYSNHNEQQKDKYEDVKEDIKIIK